MRALLISSCSFLAYSLQIPCSKAFADDEVIVVSATRLPQNIENIGSSVTVITDQDLRDGQFAFVDDALRTVPGAVVAQNGGAGSVSTLRLRGGSSAQTLVVVDGAIVNDPSSPQGAFSFADLDTAAVTRVEILRGPQGLLWGADALGGVVAVETATHADNLFSASAEGGAYGTGRGAATVSAGDDDAYARATLSGVRTAGFSRAAVGTERDGYRAATGSFRAGAAFSTAVDADLSARFTRAHTEVDGFPPPTFDLGDTGDTEDTKSFAATARLRHHAGALAGTFTASFDGVRRRGEDETGVEAFAADGKRFTTNYIASLALSGRTSVTGGAEFQRSSALVSGVDASARRGAVFGVVEYDTGPSLIAGSALILSVGGRRDEFSNFDGATTARAAAAWRFGAPARTIIRASWGSGFRAPSLFELNFSEFGVIPNPDLAPERGRGYDAGIEHRWGDANAPTLTLSATYFHQSTRDLIDFSFAQNGYFNVSRARAKGVEFAAEWRLLKPLSLNASYTFLDAVDLDAATQSLRQPRHRGAVTLNYAPIARAKFSASLFANGAEADIPTPNAAYARVDLRASYAATRAVEVYGRIENATNVRYQDVSGFRETGAAAYAGLRIKL